MPDSGKIKADSPEVLARFHRERDLVEKVARQIKRLMAVPQSIAELRSYGDEGLLGAARTFDESRGVPFRRFANLRVRGAIIDGVRSCADVPRSVWEELRRIEAGDCLQEIYDEEDAANPAPTPQAADDRLGAYLAGIATAMVLGTIARESGERGEAQVDAPDPEELAAEAEIARMLRAAVDALPDTERALLRKHYFEGATLEEAAEALGLSKSWASRVHARGVELVTRRMREAAR